MLQDVCAHAKRFLLLGVPTQLKGFLPSKDIDKTEKYSECKWTGGCEHVERVIQVLSEGAVKASECLVLGYKDAHFFSNSFNSRNQLSSSPV